MGAFESIQEEVVVAGGPVDLEMNVHGLVRVCGTLLSTPENVFPLDGGSFGVRDMQDSGFEVVSIYLNP
jgi:hypothetical protein